MIQFLENSKLIPKNQIKDYYNFLFYDGIYKDEKIRFNLDGLPAMGQKKAFLGFCFAGTRFSKNLKIQGNEIAFIPSSYMFANDNILIPFDTSGGKYGLSIYIFFWVQLSGEQITESCKRIELNNFHTSGGWIPIKNLFFEAEKQEIYPENQETGNEHKTDKKELKIHSKTDYVENKEMKYKITFYDSGEYEVFNITKNNTLKPSPMAERIFNLSKFKEDK